MRVRFAADNTLHYIHATSRARAHHLHEYTTTKARGEVGVLNPILKIKKYTPTRRITSEIKNTSTDKKTVGISCKKLHVSGSHRFGSAWRLSTRSCKLVTVVAS